MPTSITCLPCFLIAPNTCQSVCTKASAHKILLWHVAIRLIEMALQRLSLKPSTHDVQNQSWKTRSRAERSSLLAKLQRKLFCTSKTLVFAILPATLLHQTSNWSKAVALILHIQQNLAALLFVNLAQLILDQPLHVCQTWLQCCTKESTQNQKVYIAALPQIAVFNGLVIRRGLRYTYC
jgi:hypothetical protein